MDVEKEAVTIHICLTDYVIYPFFVNPNQTPLKYNVVVHGLMSVWVLHRNQAIFAQEVLHTHDEQAEETEEKSDFIQPESRMALIEIRVHQPINIHPLHHQNQNSSSLEALWIALRSLRQ